MEIISYAPLWETMKKKDISQYQLLKAGIDNKTSIANIRGTKRAFDIK